MNPGDRIHEHCCEGEKIFFKRCNTNSHSLTTGDIKDADGNVKDFCDVFFREGSFKNDVDKGGGGLVLIKVINVGSYTFGNPFFKRSYKIGHNPGL